MCICPPDKSGELLEQHADPTCHTRSPLAALNKRTTGKSTALRAIAATALLANCGLLVPARAASVPHFTGFVLRNFSGDAPTERMSAFGMEVRDMT